MKRLFPLILIMLLAFALRLYHLDAVPFRGDEAYTVQNWVLHPLSTTLSSQVIVQDPQAPLSYALFRGWSLISGTSEFSLRFLPLLFNLLGIAALYNLGRRFGNYEMGLLAALIWALHPFEIWHSQDARNYAIWAGLSALSLYLALRALQKDDKWALYVLAALLSAYVYYLEIFIMGALSLYVLIAYWGQWRIIRKWFLAELLVGLALLPWYLYLWQRLQSGLAYGGTTGSFNLPALLSWFVPTLSFGMSIPYIEITGIITAFVLLLALLWLLRRDWQKALLWALLIILPMLGLAIVSTRLNVFTPRYIMGTIPAYILLFLVVVKTHRSGYLLYGAWLIGAVISLQQYWFVLPPKAPDWPALASYLENNTQAGEAIIQTGVDPAFGYYYGLADIAAGEFGLPAEVHQPASEITATMENTAEDYHSIWIVGQTFPDWPNAGVVEDWAFAHLQLARETSIAGLPVRQFLGWDVLPSEISEEKLADFGTVALRGVRIFAPEPSHTLTIWLYWQAQSQSESSLKVFVHLVGEINPVTGTPLWSQDDQYPQNGRIDTRTWEIGSVYRDVYTLPLDSIAAGNYSLLVGFYNPETNERLLLPDGTDSYSIGQFEMK